MFNLQYKSSRPGDDTTWDTKIHFKFNVCWKCSADISAFLNDESWHMLVQNLEDLPLGRKWQGGLVDLTELYQVLKVEWQEKHP